MLELLTRARDHDGIETRWSPEPKTRVLILYPEHRPHYGELRVTCLAAAAALAVAGTSVTSHLPTLDWEVVGALSPGAGVAREEEAERPTIAMMLREIRTKSALTWEHLASIFSVSRRAVHHWARGNAVTAANRHKVKTLLERVRSMTGEEPFVIRSHLLNEAGVGVPVVDHGLRSEPILEADQSPLAAETVLRRVPQTRVRRG